MRRIVLGLLGALFAVPAPAQVRPVTPAAGLVVTRSIRLAPGSYRIPAPASPDSALITIRGDNLTLDLTGVTLEGMAPAADPDLAAGIAIRIEGGRNVRIVGGRIRGYRFGLLARGTRGLTVSGLDASHNWKPRLFSLVEHESLADWLSFHQNEKREWMRFGAAFYLEDVRGGSIRGNRAVQGMNALLMVRSDSLRIQDNDFSFNSGLGIGLYRSSDNLIVRNRLDYSVRGYSHGFYHRGQDSAGLLLYEQSSRNLVAWNSATHGGDGVFLWAGQSTMDSGRGGANDNVFYANDFSYAPANAIEATFSRNIFLANRAAGSDYGLWGGYSFASVVAGNCFLGNRIGLAIEHGQDNRITRNLFAGDTTAISLWANPIQPSDWGYPRHRDVRSRDYVIEANRFSGNRVALRIRNTVGLATRENRYERVDSLALLRDTANVTLEPLAVTTATARRADPCAAVPALGPAERRLVPALPGVVPRVPASPASRRDRSAIVVDEWGPFDWRAPKLWPLDSTRALPLRLRTLGPAGRWTIVAERGLAAVAPRAGRIGDTLRVTPAPGAGADWELVLEYRGGATVSPRGEERAAGQPVRFAWGRFEPALEWEARFVAWTDTAAVWSDSLAFARILAGPPVLQRSLSRLDFQWYRPQLPGLPQSRWALEATASVTLPPGRYVLRTISDDGIRVWVDGRLRIDRWSQHESQIDTIPLPGGRHDLRVRFFQLDGWTELRVELLREPGGTG